MPLLGPHANENGDDQPNQFVSILQRLVETERRQLESAAIADVLMDLKLFSEDDEI